MEAACLSVYTCYSSDASTGAGIAMQYLSCHYTFVLKVMQMSVLPSLFTQPTSCYVNFQWMSAWLYDVTTPPACLTYMGAQLLLSCVYNCMQCRYLCRSHHFSGNATTHNYDAYSFVTLLTPAM